MQKQLTCPHVHTHVLTHTHTHTHTHNLTEKEKAVYNNGAVFSSENSEFIIQDNVLVGNAKRSRNEGLSECITICNSCLSLINIKKHCWL